MPEAVTSIKETKGQGELYAVQDLSLPKANVRDNIEKFKEVLDSEGPISLIMEVDEVKDDPCVEAEQDENDEDSWSDLEHEHMDNFHIENWDQCPSSSHVAIPSTYGSVMCPDPKDTLLIDDQGIPYTLTSDGQKLPQLDLSELPLIAYDESGVAMTDAEMTSAFPDADSEQELFLPDVNLEDSQTTLASVVESTDGTTDETGSTELPAISTSLPSFSIKIMPSNTKSNTPILLLPPSHLQTLTTSASNANSEPVTLSLPIALSSDTKSAPVVLVLSSPEAGHFSSASSPSSVAVPSSSNPPVSNSEPVSCTTASNLSGQNKSCNYSAAPTSPVASSSTSTGTSAILAKQPITDTCSDMPTSFQEALLRLAVSAEQKNEKRPKCIDKSPAFKLSSHTEATQPLEEHSDSDQLLPVSEPESVSMDRISNEDLSLQSTLSPSSPDSSLLPSNPSKNQDPQALGPRRILYCQYCPRVFYFLSDLERHSITHSQTKPHVCQLCGKAFKRSSHLERHKHIHTGERNFECQLCPRRFREAAELTRHQRVHTGEKPYQCLLCHMRFAERNTLRRHTKRKHQGQQQEAMNSKRKAETEDVSLVGMHGQPEENAEWYISKMNETESDNDTGGE